MRDAPVGIFDSGVGGLTVLKALLQQLPAERFVYLGDTARLPYGSKSPQTIARYSQQAAAALARHDIKCLVIACNTASSVGLPLINSAAGPLPVVGVIEPGAHAACMASRSGNIAVLATEATIREGAYRRAILGRRPDAHVTSIAAPLFVALAEEGLDTGPIADSITAHYLAPLFAPHSSSTIPDTLVLGCTHFPMLRAAIRGVVGSEINIVDSAETTAAAVAVCLRERHLEAAAGQSVPWQARGRVSYLATDSAERFARIGSRFLQLDIAPDEVGLIDLQSGSA